MKYYPIQLNIANKPVLVVGGGEIATRRLLGLLEARARPTVVAPEVTEEIKKLSQKGLLVLVERAFREVDLGGVLLVFAATSDENINREVALASRRRKILCNVVDRPLLCDFVVPSRMTRGDFMLTISTDGRVPFLAKSIRQELEKLYGPEMSVLTELLAEKRHQLQREGKKNLLDRLSKLDLTHLREVLRQGSSLEGAQRWLDQVLEGTVGTVSLSQDL